MSRNQLRALGAVSLAALTLIILGCMNLSFGGRNYAAPIIDDGPGVFSQEGCVAFKGGEERTVYYPVPYCSPPNLNLEVDNPFLEVTLIDQKADQFRYACKGQVIGRAEVSWKAKGVRASGPPLIAPPLPPPVPGPAQLPLLPVPVEKAKD